MRWIHDYQLFLFDFDGLLVNTEEAHFEAYKRMCAARDVTVDWDFNRYCQTAHYGNNLQEQFYAEYPQLRLQEPVWDVLYAEKKAHLHQIFQEGKINLMPGVEKLLTALYEASIARCVVTHSPEDLVERIRQCHPILNTIPVWITREYYTNPKPHPECYIKAIELMAHRDDRVIGFEDTPRGLRALMETRATPILICKASYPEIPSFVRKGVKHFQSFENLNHKLIL